MSRRAIILAGGKGTRLRPYTIVLPKPMMPIGELPILELIIRQLANHGFTHVTMAVNHQAEIIMAYFGDGRKWDIQIDYSLESKPLNTMGPLRQIEDLPEDFLVMNGDILTDLSFSELYDHHVRARNIFTISSYSRKQLIDYGVLEVGPDHKLSGFREKPTLDVEVSMGVYMANRAVLELIPPDTAYGFDQLMLDLLAAGRPAATRRFDGYWLDIGRPDDYNQALEEFEPMRARFLACKQTS